MWTTHADGKLESNIGEIYDACTNYYRLGTRMIALLFRVFNNRIKISLAIFLLVHTIF